MDLESYRKRLGANNTSESLENSTVGFVSRSFNDSPLFQVIQLNGIDTDARINSGKDSTLKEALFRPKTDLHRGMVANFNGQYWLSLRVRGNEIYPKADLKLCNQTFYIDGSEQHGITSKTSVHIDGEERYMDTPDGEMTLLLPYNTVTETIAIKSVFEIGEMSFEVIGKDYLTQVVDGKGILTLTLKSTTNDATYTTEPTQDDSGSSDSGWGEW